MLVRHLMQEAWEMGFHRFAYRVAWEVANKNDIVDKLEDWRDSRSLDFTPHAHWTRHLPFHDAVTVAQTLTPHVSQEARNILLDRALAATQGNIFSFGAVQRSFGSPIDWHLQPESGQRWPAGVSWRQSLAEQKSVGDVKLTWEPARFPQAYHMARAAAFFPEHRALFAHDLARQLEAFVTANPFALGVHWFSGQEIAVRLFAWLFATRTLFSGSKESDQMAMLVGQSLYAGAVHIRRHVNYARVVVYNNHLIAEVLVLLAAAVLLPNAPDAAAWRQTAMRVLDNSARKQFYPDGSYINQSHTYARVALQYLVWACLLQKADGRAPSPHWLDAMDRALTFLLAHQCPKTGQLPNFGANDGAQPTLWTTCDYTDFRPILQVVSVLCRGERVYDRGPWDEATAWCAGPLALDAPLRPPSYRSRSFPLTGHHVLRGANANTYLSFRCGTVRERLTQADLLHVDLWVDGHNVLVDGGSYLYNGPAKWHEHFVGTASHNTLTVAGKSQMLHFRKFKNIYLATAKLLHFNDTAHHATATGEHYGYVASTGCVHRRSVLFLKDHTWVIADTLRGQGGNRGRLHWLAAPAPFAYDEARGRLHLTTPAGDVYLAVYDADARPRAGNVVQGADDPPRGWYSRNYSVKVPAPSLAVEVNEALPITFITVIGREPTTLSFTGTHYVLDDKYATRFSCHDGILHGDVGETAEERL